MDNDKDPISIKKSANAVREVLLICGRYSVSNEERYLTNDIVCGLEQSGCRVTVLGMGDIIGRKVSICEKNWVKREYLVPFYYKWRFLKYFLIWPRLIIKLAVIWLTNQEFERVIVFGPLLPFWPISLMIGFFNAKKICIITDIFPIHHNEIGAIPQGLTKSLKILESLLLRKYQVITGMSPANVEAIKSYYLLRGQDVRELRLWGTKYPEAVIIRDNRLSQISLVFGGQITFGRDIEELLWLMRELKQRQNSLQVDIYSSGKYFDRVRARYANRWDWITFRERISRESYLLNLPRYDIGLITTMGRVSVPTFPSKIIDYLCSGLKVICLIEKASDIEKVIADPEHLIVNNYIFSEANLNAISLFMQSALQARSEKRVRYFREEFSYLRAAQVLLEI